MKKGISIWSFATSDLKEIFTLAKNAGFEGVEIDLSENGPINLNSTKADADKVLALAGECGIELYSVASGLYWGNNLISDDPSIRAKTEEIIKKHLEVASWLGCDTILVVPGAIGADFVPGCEAPDYVTAYERGLDAMKRLAPVAEKFGVVIGLENVWNKFLLSPVEMRDFIDKVGSPFVQSYFDVGNVLYSGYPEHWIRALGSRIKKVHFKDYRRDAGGLCGFVDILSGDVNYPEVMKAFGEIGYDGWVTAEMLPPYKNYPEAIIYNTSFAMDKILGRK